MQCPVCMAETFIVINPPKGFETYGTAQAICRDQKWCEWKSGHVATHGAWEDALEWRANANRSGQELAIKATRVRDPQAIRDAARTHSRDLAALPG